MTNEKNSSYRLLILVTTPKLAEKAMKLFNKADLPMHYRIEASGTASSEIMDMLGLGSIDKVLLFSTMPKFFADKMLGKLKKELKLGAVNSGIAVTIPLTGTNNLLFHILEHIAEENSSDEKKEMIEMDTTRHAMIAAIVNRGFGENVMDAAKAAGAGGGTIVNCRRKGNEEAANFWGLSVQEEKELVMIISDVESKVEIMRKIGEKCGINSEAQGVVLSLPVDSVIGL